MGRAAPNRGRVGRVAGRGGRPEAPASRNRGRVGCLAPRHPRPRLQRRIMNSVFKIYVVRVVALLLCGGIFVSAAESVRRKGPTMADVLAASKPGDWRALDPENALYVEFASGRVVIELAPDFAPRHVANVKALAREQYYDGLAIVRVQDNYVVQLADPDAEKPELARKSRRAQRTLPAEFERTDLEIMLTGTPAFTELIESRRNRREDWFQAQAGRVDIC